MHLHWLGVGLTESGLISGLLNKSEGKNTNKQSQNLCTKYASLALECTDATKDSASAALKDAITMCQKAVGTDNTTLCGESKSDSCDNIKIQANRAKGACEELATGNVASENKNARWAVPVATTLAAGGLGLGITASVIKAKKEDIKNSAAQQWMDEVGEHIQCYIGTEELGTYGDVVSIELD